MVARAAIVAPSPATPAIVGEAFLLERAQDLLSHAVPNRSLEEVHLRALCLLVDQLEKRKYGALRKKPPAESSANSESEVPTVAPDEPPPQASQGKKRTRVPRQRVESPRPVERSKKRTRVPRQRGPASVRREVRERDGLQCTAIAKTAPPQTSRARYRPPQLSRPLGAAGDRSDAFAWWFYDRGSWNHDKSPLFVGAVEGLGCSSTQQGLD